PRGVTAALLIPAVWASFPVLSNFQYGQFHLPSIGLAILGMILFSSKRYALGGAALAVGMVAKIAPGILLVYLLVKKRYREVGWTLGFCVVYTALAYAVVGPEPFRAFFDYHLPRLNSGAAFDFASAWPDFTDLIIAGNQSPWGVVYKLGALGVAGMGDMVARGAHIIYALGALVVAALVARRNTTRFPEPLIWLALINLAGLVSKGAWGDYIAVGTVWAMTYLTLEFAGSLKQRLYLALCWVFLALSLGVMPAPVLIEMPQVMILLSLIGVITLVSVNIWIALGRPAPAQADA
ncbi:MAG TPA: glycosyltransferase family 87 protein, partial [candidate division Zixibacteria bacterium]|nr:glycosyltransferase family 87 protein [candidate division Zixibacteria bacterium]